MPTFRDLLHLLASHANFWRPTSPPNFSRQLLEIHFTCQPLVPTSRECLHLPTSHANLYAILNLPTSQAQESYFACQLRMPAFWVPLHLAKAQSSFSGVPLRGSFFVRTLWPQICLDCGEPSAEIISVLARPRCDAARMCLQIGEPSAEIMRVRAS